jgi:transketolase
VLDGEVSDSTRTGVFADAHPDRFFEFYIAEQQMVAAAVGMQVREWVPFLSTFAAFLTRAHDFVRMAAISGANLRIAGSHAGVEIGQDGPSQMGREDLAMFRATHGSTVLYPCDANQTARLVAAMADRGGISYMRTTRGATPVIYGPGEEFAIGGSRVLRASDDDDVTIVAAGITVHEALSAADRLASDGIRARVIDTYSVKPIDAGTLRAAVNATGRLVTAEDHWPEGGLGDAVLAALAGDHGDGGAGKFVRGPGAELFYRKLAVRDMPGSAAPDEQLQSAGIDAEAIVSACTELVSAR